MHFFQFRSGKSFYCARCRRVFSTYLDYSRHRETHALPPVPAPATSGPSRQGIYLTSDEIETSEAMDVQVGGADNPPAYRIELSGVRRFARATATESTYRVRFNDQWQGRRLMDLRRQLYRMFEEVLQRARMGLEDNDLVRVIIRHDALNHAVVIPLREVDDADVETILQKIEHVLQSDETLSIDDSFQGKACGIFFSIQLPDLSHECSFLYFNNDRYIPYTPL